MVSLKGKINRNYFNYFLCFAILSLFAIQSIAQDSLALKGNFFRKNLSLTHAFVKSSYQFSKIFVSERNQKRINSIKADGYKLVFEDNFDSLNTDVWRVGQPWGEYHPGNLHQYFGKKEVVFTDSGNLYLGAAYLPKTFIIQDTNSVTIPYAIGLINSDISYTPKYGYFEMRCKMPEGAATWPAFWLTGKTRWPPEIDIFENYGGKKGKDISRQTQSVHYGVSGKKSRGFIPRGAKIYAKKDTTFHTYACEWTTKYIKFYTDGKLIRYQRVNKKLRSWLNEEMTIILNNGLESKYLPKNKSSYPTNYLVVDWIRVWQKES